MNTPPSSACDRSFATQTGHLVRYRYRLHDRPALFFLLLATLLHGRFILFAFLPLLALRFKNHRPKSKIDDKGEKEVEGRDRDWDDREEKEVKEDRGIKNEVGNERAGEMMLVNEENEDARGLNCVILAILYKRDMLVAISMS